MIQSRDNRLRRPRRGGFTLVELLVAMTVTLILIFALAQAFAVVGEAVGKGRAAIEMAGNLRMVANQLQRDLQGLTVPARTAADDGGAPGYFEILDQASTDKDWDADGTNDINPSTSDTTYGDVDDVIAFTTRNAESPFFGTAYESGSSSSFVNSDTGQSTLAEIVWWIQYQDLNDNGIRDSGELFLIYRRAMMIRPDLNDLPIRELSGADPPRTPPVFTFGDGVVIRRNTDGTIIATYPNDPPHHLILRDDLLKFYNDNDVSVRLNWWINSSGVNVQLSCNSLADLTKRENRYAHRTILSDRPALTFPPVAAQGAYMQLPGPVFPFRLDTNRRSVTSLYRNTKHGNNLGEDVMVSNALAFDVQVFDPEVPLITWNTGDGLVPSDPGYFEGFDQNSPPNGIQVGEIPTLSFPVNPPSSYLYVTGYGAFVDLGYGSRIAAHVNARGWSLFSGVPKTRSELYFGNIPIYDYCTWSMHYERDNVDQDGDGQGPDGEWGRSGVDDDGNGTTDDIGERGWPGSDDLVDEGTNGFDDFVMVGTSRVYRNGVDDVEERETSPPYPVPLRGIQIQIRTWDPDSRQIRQATVVSDFVPE